MRAEFLSALVGGALIGLAASIYLLLNGRIMGISGHVGTLLRRRGAESVDRSAVLLGLIAGGAALALFAPERLANTADRSLVQIAAAGLLVGFGTSLANGCTSGHGVCGISRFSRRSIVATLTFMMTGFLTVFFLKG